jgi:ketosteroid isomerase-like protein
MLTAALTIGTHVVAQQTPWSEAFAQSAKEDSSKGTLANEAKEQLAKAEQFRNLPAEQVALFLPIAKEIFAEGYARAEVEHVLLTQQEAWNHHALDAFMAGYWKSAELTFFSGARQTSGWQATLDRYKATYDSPGHEMGKLEFSNLRVEALGPDAAFVRGEFHLTMSDGKAPHGIFTLVFRKFTDGWKIVHDHTSAAE